MKDIALHLRYESKRTDLPNDVIQTLSEAYAEISRLERERDYARCTYCLALSSEGQKRPSDGVYDVSVYNEAKLLAKQFDWGCFKENNNG